MVPYLGAAPGIALINPRAVPAGATTNQDKARSTPAGSRSIRFSSTSAGP